jgi:hypothetical protein
MLLKHIAMVCILLLVSSAVSADDAHMASAFKQFMAAPDGPIILRGDYFKAALIAYRDFAKVVAPSLQDGTAHDPKQARNRPDIRDYDISIDQTPAVFIVQFGAANRDPSHVVFGGGAKYTIDRASLKILNRTLLK